MKIQFPHDFSNEVPWRKCEGAFPEWEIPNEDMYGWGIEFSNIPDICKTCPYIDACCMQVSQILLMNMPFDRDWLNQSSIIFSSFKWFDIEAIKKVTIIDAPTTRKKPTKKLR